MSTQPWGHALGAAALVNAVTLIGVVLLGIPALRSTSQRDRRTTVTLACGFAAGALLSTAFFLMLSESFELVGKVEEHHENEEVHRLLRRLSEEERHDEHEGETAEEHAAHGEAAETVWHWSIMVFAGFCVVLLLDLLMSAASALLAKPAAEAASPAGEGALAAKKGAAGEELGEAAADVAVAPSRAERASIRRLVFATVVGDAMHNFSDGVFIATAFKTCDPKVGWAVVVGTIAHEIAQELADFLVLATVCSIRPMYALALNFASGVTIFLGAAIVLSSELTDRSVGLLLAFGAGLYLYNAAVECVPRVMSEPELRTKAAGLALFVLGAIAIGLVLLGHIHCEAGHEEAGHAEEEEHHDEH